MKQHHKKITKKKKWTIIVSTIGGSMIVINSILWIPYGVNYLNLPGDRFVDAQDGWATSTNDGASWMSHINKDISLSKINIPGSHDAMTKNVDLLPFVASTQAYSIEEQLNAGIRYFDIRVVTDPNNTNRWYINHGPAKCYDENSKLLYYDRVEATIHSFLQEHPTETVLVQVFDREDVFTFDNLNFLNQTIYKHTDWYYQTPGIPKLNECAGKMILAHRFSLDRSDGVVIPPCGIDVSSWPNIIDNNSNLIGIVQDDWNCGNPKYKWNHNVYPLINTPPQPNNDKDFIFINCLNATGSPFNYGPLPDPKLMAKQINDAFLKTTLTYKNWYGWYLFDSHKNDLSSDINIAHKLYVTNEFFS